MQKKASAKGGTKNRKARRKLLDLPARTVKRGDAGSIKGGIPRIGQEVVVD